EAGDVVASTLDAEQEIVLARKLHARDHIGGAEAADDGGGLPVEHPVPDGPGLFIAGIARHGYRSTETHLQCVQSLLLQVELAAIRRHRFHRGAPLPAVPVFESTHSTVPSAPLPP